MSHGHGHGTYDKNRVSTLNNPVKNVELYRVSEETRQKGVFSTCVCVCECDSINRVPFRFVICLVVVYL